MTTKNNGKHPMGARVVLVPAERLPWGTRIAIISDVHLGMEARLYPDKDELLIRTLELEAERADVVILNGDIVDHMRVKDEARIEQAHPRVFEALRRLPDKRPVYYCPGNHEQAAALRHAFPDFRYVNAVAVGDELLVAHGHQFDLHWESGETSHIGHDIHAWAEDAARQPIRLPLRDYDNWLNRFAHRTFFRWTQLLRLYGACWRALGRPGPYDHWRRVDEFWSLTQWGDTNAIFTRALEYLQSDVPWRTLVLGHSHQPGVVEVGYGTYANTGSWCFESATYTRIDGDGVRVFDAVSGKEHRDEAYRMVMLDDVELPDMAGWFRRYYRGFLQYDMDAVRRDFPENLPPRRPNEESGR